MSKVRNTIAWAAYSSGRLMRPAPSVSESSIRDELPYFIRLATWRPWRHSDTTVPLSMPLALPAEIAITSRGPPARNMSVTASTRMSRPSLWAAGTCGKNCRS
ncbi:hypothetical protein D3C81_2054370 [compost metagenome]